jgi:branched-subunit amino acid transport protein AzlD
MWQDTALTLINFVFIITVLPAIILNHRSKNASGQSLIMYLSTSLLLVLMAYVFYTLDLFWSMISTLGNAVVWTILTIQRLQYNHNPGNRP